MAAVPSFMSMSCSIVTIKVGDPPVDFPVHQDLLCTVAPYFRGAFQGGVKEAEEKSISLHDVSEQTFRAFPQWAYAQITIQGPNSTDYLTDTSLPAPSGSTTTPPDANDETEQTSLDGWNLHSRYNYSACQYCGRDIRQPVLDGDGLEVDSCLDKPKMTQLYYTNSHWISQNQSMQLSFCELFMFADKYAVHQLRDDIMTALFCHAKAWGWLPFPSTDLINLCYDNFSSSSHLIKYYVMTVAYDFDPSTETAANFESMRDLPSSYLYDLMLAQAILSRWAQPNRFQNSCLYHDHAILKEEDCQARKLKNKHLFVGLIEACGGRWFE